MTAKQCRIAAGAFLIGTAICGLYAWTTYRQSAQALESFFGGARAMGMEPAISESGRAALYVAALMIVGALASYRMSFHARD